MTKSDDIKQRLERTKSNAPKDRYLSGMFRGVARTAGTAKPWGTQFDSSRIGRGSRTGRILKSREIASPRFAGDTWSSGRASSVLKAPTLNAAWMYFGYLQWNSVAREGLAGELYNAKNDRAEVRKFQERGEGGGHQIRLIFSAEVSASCDDLKSWACRLVEQMEKDIGIRLDRGQSLQCRFSPYHVMVSGRDDRRNDPIITLEYITKKMRERAAEIVLLDLQPRTDREIENRIHHEVDWKRRTSIDRICYRRRIRAGDDPPRSCCHRNHVAHAAQSTCGKDIRVRPRRRARTITNMRQHRCNALWHLQREELMVPAREGENRKRTRTPIDVVFSECSTTDVFARNVITLV